jgi:hypothetical protein
MRHSVDHPPSRLGPTVVHAREVEDALPGEELAAMPAPW